MNRVRVVVDTPAHAGMAELLDYDCEHPLAAGTLVRVPLGRREVPGIVWAGGPDEAVLGALKKSTDRSRDFLTPSGGLTRSGRFGGTI